VAAQQVRQIDPKDAGKCDSLVNGDLPARMPFSVFQIADRAIGAARLSDSASQVRHTTSRAACALRRYAERRRPRSLAGVAD
jgi:hypothetical protein